MFKNIFYSLLTKGIVALINFIILILTARYLGVSSRGEISIFILNITIIQILNEVYTGYSMVHFVPRFNLKKIIVFGICYTFVFSSLSNSIVCFFNKQVPGYEWLGYLISLLVILNTFNCVIILGKQDIKRFNFLSFLQPFLLLFGILVCVFGFRIYTFNAYAYPLLFSFAIAFIISSRIVLRFFWLKNSPNDFNLKPIFIKGIMFQAAILMYIFVNRYSYYLLPNSASVGLYSSASTLMESLLIFTNSIAPVLMARVSNEGNTMKSIKLTLTLSKVSFFFSAICAFVIFLIPESFLTLVLGDGFLGIKSLMLLYAPGILLVSFFGSISYYYSAIGKQKLVLFCYSLGFITTWFFAPVLIAMYGSKGAAYNANISYVMMTVAICISFIVTNKLSWRRFFSVGSDYKNLIQLIIKNG
jgi:O-antigen/teichoic acid export membrane protein